MILVFLALITPSEAEQFKFSDKLLGCGILSGDFRNEYVNLTFPLQPRESIIWNGTVWNNASSVKLNILFPGHTIPFHMRSTLSQNRTGYHVYFNNRWDYDSEEFESGKTFESGKPFQVKTIYTGHTFIVYFNDYLVHIQIMTTDPCIPLTSIHADGDLSTNWISRICAPAKAQIIRSTKSSQFTCDCSNVCSVPKIT
ncbi:unnamed protein product [Caenorhabditis sp. 36 PRJEB53466]|nr:unnamed protein product [Caenorhabditis sp. 36 PRJEB53466]